MNKKEVSNSIEELTKILKLPATRKYFKELAKDAATRDVSYEEYLFSLLQKECDIRAENAIKSRIRRAQYPYKKYLEDLEVEYLPQDAQKNYVC